jgi:hypothetical protein
LEGLEGFGGAGRVWWSSKGSVEPEGFGGARRVWWGPKGLVGPEGFGGARRVWWGPKGLAGFEGFGGVGFRESSLLGFHHGFYGTQPVLGRTF